MSMPKSTVKLAYSKNSGETFKPTQPTGGQKKRRFSRTRQETNTPSCQFCFLRNFGLSL
jgi:hypothetical protein